eukprot:c445_g1_i1 orf=529-1602(-)
MRPQALLLPIFSLWIIWVASFVKATQLGAVSFFESTPGSYLRTASSNSLQGGIFSYADVSAATVVLLGSAPPASISDESVSKLNELLVPNPFHRPHAVLLLTLEQIKPDKRGNIGSISAQHRELQLETTRGALMLPEDTLLRSLNMTFREDGVVDKEMEELASFLGGSYEMTKESSKGVLSVDLPDGDMVTLDLEKKEHRALAYELFSICQHVKDAAATLDKRSGGLVVGTLTLAKELYEEPDSSITLREASDLLHLVVTKAFACLDTALNGGLVGVIVHAQEQILDLSFSSGPPRLQLLQTSSDTITAAVAEVLTETIIAYITGILFIIALIIGTCFLFKMPVTRDTLLYSGAKLD